MFTYIVMELKVYFIARLIMVDSFFAGWLIVH